MSELVFFLEEESAKALLEQIFPRLIPQGSQVYARFIVFEGKRDLEKQLLKKLRGYLNPRARFIVMRDQDQTDCKKTKRSLAALCARAGRPQTTVRIACRELEAFYLGDLRAVELGLGVGGLAGKQNKAKFRDTDRLASPSRELEKLTGNRYQQSCWLARHSSTPGLAGASIEELPPSHPRHSHCNPWPPLKNQLRTYPVSKLIEQSQHAAKSEITGIRRTTSDTIARVRYSCSGLVTLGFRPAAPAAIFNSSAFHTRRRMSSGTSCSSIPL